ncbi:hypothetical protein [Rugosimonospora africana]|uniref:Uncharacterized protein n=1 Tax=Rugosimonospora africana TaxID=556532 RepID=A0A8J3VTK7_9ACTN|nr:hypothetical protein [Rugosimonospora africana]GIH18537.1 hypothetical protein Raf01_67090 [Rugosimonospora africana]
MAMTSYWRRTAVPILALLMVTGSLLGSGSPAVAGSTTSDRAHVERAIPQVVPPGAPGLNPAPVALRPLTPPSEKKNATQSAPQKSVGPRQLPRMDKPIGMTLDSTKATKDSELRMVERVRALDAPTCVPYMARFITPNVNGPGTVSVSYAAEVLCNFYLAGAVQAYLYDRTNGAFNNGSVISNADPYYFYDDYQGVSGAVVTVNGNLYDGARQVEIGFSIVLQTLDGTPWGSCVAPLPSGQRYLSTCDGLGTDRLSVEIGSGIFDTGLPAYNPAAAIRDDPSITLATGHTGGVDAASTARQNILDAAAGLPARTSGYSDVGARSVYLDIRMLRGLLWMNAVYGYNFYVTEVSGGDHSTNSLHYAGEAFDVGIINGVQVTASNPNYRAFMDGCRTLGAYEVLGPGDKGHNTHIHCAWR